jgi:hypothetical protein
MLNEPNFDEAAIRIGIASDRLREGLRTHEVMGVLFPALEVAGLEVGLYGGTALNKIYFGKRQRLSYDIDIYCVSLPGVVKAIRSLGGEQVAGVKEKFGRNERRRLRLRGVDIDLWEAKMPEKPAKLQAVDLLQYLGYLVQPVVVPSFSLEYLLANKTIAMADRNELKDIYDTWMGLSLIRDKRKYRRYLRAVSRERGIEDYEGYIDYQISDVMLRNLGYYEKRRIDVTEVPTTERMLREIADALAAM